MKQFLFIWLSILLLVPQLGFAADTAINSRPPTGTIDDADSLAVYDASIPEGSTRTVSELKEHVLSGMDVATVTNADNVEHAQTVTNATNVTQQVFGDDAAYYYPDNTEADQGVTAVGSGDTIYDVMQEVGTSGTTVIVLRKVVLDGETNYALDTSIDLTTYPNIFFDIQPGAEFTRVTGDEVLTVYSPQHIKAGDGQEIANASMISFAQPGIVPEDWFGVAFTGTLPEGIIESFSDGTDNIITEFDTPSYMNGDRVIAISHEGSPLRTYIADDPVGDGTRLYVWDKTTTLPMVPHTSIRPTFAVYGDILVGDIVALESNPMTYFVRANTGLAETAVTQFFSAQNGAADTDGGAMIVYAPALNGGGAVNDGYIDFSAYGLGTGALANSIMFGTRESAGTVTRRWQVDGQSTSKGDLKPYADDTYSIGAAGAQVKEVFAKKVTVAASVSWTAGSGTPEGSVTAAPGSLYTDTGGGASTTLYVKESGSGNTGWVAK